MFFVVLVPGQDTAAGSHHWMLINPSPCMHVSLVGVEMCGPEGVIRSYGAAFLSHNLPSGLADSEVLLSLRDSLGS